MTIDPTIYVKQAIIAALKADATLTAMVPAARIYPQKTPNSPAWPFIRYGASSSVPLRPDGGSGGEVRGEVRCFAKSTDSQPDAENRCADIQRRIAEVIEALFAEPLSTGAQMDALIIGVRLEQDRAEADIFVGSVEFQASVV